MPRCFGECDLLLRGDDPLPVLGEWIENVANLPNFDRELNLIESKQINASCLPGPVNEHLPIWIGGVGEKRTLRMAAKYADGWNAAYISPSEFQRLGGVLDGWCETENRDPNEIERSINLQFYMGADQAGADAQMAGFKQQWGDMAGRVSGGLLSGTPVEAVEKILEFKAAGADMVNVAFRAPLEPEAVEAYLTQVVPAVRSAS